MTSCVPGLADAELWRVESGETHTWYRCLLQLQQLPGAWCLSGIGFFREKAMKDIGIAKGKGQRWGCWKSGIVLDTEAMRAEILTPIYIEFES